ncbi:23S rRNA (uracil-5-)-methyltransferase RumA [Clostridia bacterium]|nr:23S rRNA (uracil-5-)-methyltransferase RumA [Clostridia bacterium]
MESEKICPHAGICGGCAYHEIPYEDQLQIKMDAVLDHLATNKITIDPVDIKPIRQTSELYTYRNKMEYSFGDEMKDGPMTLGLHKRGSYMSVIDTVGCLLVPESFNVIHAAVLEWAYESGHSFHHKRTHHGFLRNLVLRCGVRTGEVLVNLVTSSEETLDEAAFTERILSLGIGGLVGILHTINDRRSDVVAVDRVCTLYGRDHYFEEMLGLRFRVGAFSFFQTNPAAVESMLTEAAKMLTEATETQSKSAGTLYDIYCGTGTIALALSGSVERVIGIELICDSVVSARENADINGIGNCEFICGDAFEILENAGALGLPAPDLITVDPPRMGLHPKALKRVISYGLPRILYVSCQPKTFSENMAVMQYAGYRLAALGVYDNFPFTKHTELVGLIERDPIR